MENRDRKFLRSVAVETLKDNTYGKEKIKKLNSEIENLEKILKDHNNHLLNEFGEEYGENLTTEQIDKLDPVDRELYKDMKEDQKDTEEELEKLREALEQDLKKFN